MILLALLILTITISCRNGTGGSSSDETTTTSYLYVANWGGDSVTAYKIGSGGALSLISDTVADSSYSADSPLWGIAISGSHFYVMEFSNAAVAAYAIGAGGALTSGGSYTAGTNPLAIAIGTVTE